MKKIQSTIGWPVLILVFAALAGFIAIMAFLQPAPASADEAEYYLDCPTTEVREGDSVDVFLVRVTNHQHSQGFGAYWHTDAGTASIDDYVRQNTSDPSDFDWATDEELAANRNKRTFRTREDALSEGSETFTVRFSPTSNVVDLNDPDRDHKCEITIVDAPSIAAIGIISEPVRDNNTYGIGETIEIQATFTSSVDVATGGNPGLGLRVGDTWRSARYLRGSGSYSLVFGYKVKATDSDDDGIRLPGGYQDNDGQWHNLNNHSAITTTETGIVVSRVYLGIDDQADHKVNGSLTPIGTGMEITSEPASGDTYRYGETIEVALTFSAAVDVDGAKHLNGRVGTGDNTHRRVRYQEGSGTDTLVFGYTVRTSDMDTDGFRVGGSYITDGTRRGFGGDGTIKVKGTDIEVPPNFSGLSNQSEHKLDGRPYAETIAITSTPEARADTYGIHEVIRVSVNFGQEVDAARSAYVVVTKGSARDIQVMEYALGSGTDTLVFESEVQRGDRDTDGVSIHVPSSLHIYAKGTDIAYQSDPGGETPTLEDQPDHKVDGSLGVLDETPPTISTVHFAERTDPEQDTAYEAGDWIGVDVRFSEGVIAVGEIREFDGTLQFLLPQLELDIGGVSRFAEVSSPDGGEYLQVPGFTLVFGYTVQEGDVDDDGISIGADAINLVGLSTINDRRGNDAVLTHAAVAPDSAHTVDAPDVTGPTVSSLAITSDPGDDDIYAAGDSIEVTVTFNEDISVTLTPQLELDLGGTAQVAGFTSATGASAVFSYTVAAGNSDSDGISVGENKLSLDEGTIRDAAGNDATLTHDALENDADHQVEAVGPTISSIAFTSDPGDDETYDEVGDTIEVTVTFNEDVTVDGTPQLEIDVGGTARTADYDGGTGSSAVFIYTVALGDADPDGIAIGANKLSLNGGAIEDDLGNAATLSHDAVAADSGHQVAVPTTSGVFISSVAVTSDPGDDETYEVGDSIEVTVTFNEEVTVTGIPYLEIDVGGAARIADYDSLDGASVVFKYTVVVGDEDTDGIAIGADKLSLDGGTIEDASGSAATLTHDAVGADSGHKVSAPGGL